MSKPIYGNVQLKTQSELQFADSDNTNYVSLKAPAAVGSNLPLTLPGTDTASGVLSSNGSGVLSLALLVNANVDAAAAIAYSKLALSNSIVNADINSSAAIDASKIANGTVSSTEFQYLANVTSDIQTQFSGKASTALDNLASVAINTSLISDTDNTDDLGSSASGWANGFINQLRMDSNGQTTGLQGSASASASVNYSLPPADGTSGFVLSTNGSGVLSWVSNASSSSHAEDWDTADTATFAITHNLGTRDVIVQIYDRTTFESIGIDSEVRTDANTVTVTASEAPPAGGWRVLILAV